MRRWLAFAAAGVLVAADAALLLGVARARRGEPEARLLLTERELALPPRNEENSALSLRLNWWGGRVRPRDETLDAARLAALGFDTSSRRPAARRVYVVLELRPEAPEGFIRLARVDAGRDARLLRERYPDRQRYAIAAGVARMWWNSRLGSPGGIVTPATSEVYVPPEYMRVFTGLTPPGRYEVALCYDRNGDPWICGAQRRQ